MSNATAPVIEAEVFLKCQNTLGEGILWDSKTQLLHWVDIDTAEIHTVDPESMKYSVDSYPETTYVTALALRKDQPGFVGTIAHEIVLFPQPTTPSEVTTSPVPVPRTTQKTLSAPLELEVARTTRFNDGACDPVGRFFAGSMTAPGHQDGTRRGELWRYDPDGKATHILSGLGTSNGIGWSPDHKTMYYIDSGDHEISTFAYNISTGALTDRRTFAKPPPPMEPSGETTGVFDGLTMDGLGNIWVARWKDQRVLGYRADGSLICHIRTTECLSPTIPCFGGKNLETMYIATANSKLANEGDIQEKFPHSGDLFKVDFGPGSEVRKLLGEGWKGAERNRFVA